MKTSVSKELCIGCEMCPSIAPALYAMEADGKAYAIKTDISGAESAGAREAADNCPTDAISVS